MGYFNLKCTFDGFFQGLLNVHLTFRTAMAGINVKKRNGTVEPLQIDKISKMVSWAVEGLHRVSASEIELGACGQFYDGVTSDEIHETLIRTAADKISAMSSDYQFAAARLMVMALRKKAYQGWTPPTLLNHISTMVEQGLYDKQVFKAYTKEDIEKFDSVLNHDRDLDLAYAATLQYAKKYLIQNRVTGDVYESPNMALMVISMFLFINEKDIEQRNKLVEDFYEAISQGKISLPTPIMGGLRTPTRQFSSCVLIEIADSLASINGGNSAVVRYIAQRAGIGLNAGQIRAEGSEIRGGEAYHTGFFPFWKMFAAAVKSCSQGGLRGGAATLFFPAWHKDFEAMIMLKNNRGTEDNRIQRVDYGVQLNHYLYNRLVEGKPIFLMCPTVFGGELYKAFFADQDEFARLYELAIADATIDKVEIPSLQFFSTIMMERAATGRIYIQNVDHCNTHSPFNPSTAPVKQSNLCVAPETTILTKTGNVQISEVAGSKVEIWNGEEWSEVDVVKTGENQNLVKVTTSSGQTLTCTPYHKWYVVDSYNSKPREARTHELKVGDKLIKFSLPTIQGELELPKAYINGFYTGDGCLTPQGQRIYLYGDKIKLKSEFESGGKWVDQPELGRSYNHFTDLKDKYFVPNAEYTIESRIEWLAGFYDADGTVYRNGETETLVTNSVNLEFLLDLQLMLQTLGINAKIRKCAEEGYRPLPANDGTGESKMFLCSTLYRLMLNVSDTQKVLDLGAKFRRLKVSKRDFQRDARKFNTIESITDEGRIDDTYCLTEPKRHMAVFNGILTGQCLEIALPTKPLDEDNPLEGEIALCTLAALNVGVITFGEIPNLMRLLVRALDNILDYQDYPKPAAKRSVEKFRPLGIGVINYAYFLAQNGKRYSDGSGLEITHRLFERIQYHGIRASVELAKERGTCTEFWDSTTYAEGILPIDTYKRAVDEFAGFPLEMDWEKLRGEVKEFGMRNATITALMPSETSSQIANATNGIEPAKSLVTSKGSKDGLVKQVVPDLRGIGHQYETVWEMNGNNGYLQLCSVMQKFVDQAISANTNYQPDSYPSKKVPMSELLQDLLTAHKYGLKTLYYHNNRNGEEDIVDGEEDCAGGACKI